MPDNREIAALAWLGAAGVRVLSQQKLRESIGGVLRAFLQPLIIIPLAAMFAWIGLELWVGARLALWNVTLAKSTLLWTLGSAAVLFFNCTVPAVESTTRLGDWYGNILRIGVRQHLLFISERSRLPVIVPLREAKRLSTVFPEAVCDRLGRRRHRRRHRRGTRADVGDGLRPDQESEPARDDERLRVHGTGRRPVAGSA